MNELTVVNNGLVESIGALANHYSNQNKLNEYVSGLSINTMRAQKADLQSFCDYMGVVGIVLSVDTLMKDVNAWGIITYGLVDGFKAWMLKQGFAVSSINRKLSTVKAYCGVAYSADVLDMNSNMKIRMIKSITSGRNVDASRKNDGIETRKSTKKLQSTVVTEAQVKLLKQQPATPQGLRDEIIIRLCFEYALRVSEVANLKVEDVNLDACTLRVYRIKTDTTDTFDLLQTPETYRKLKMYIRNHSFDGQVYLLRGSVKGGKLSSEAMNERNIAKRIELLGETVGIEGLSPHDARHAWATQAVKKGVNAFTIKEFGGWSSMETVKRYVDKSEVISVGMVVFGE